jgi:hypothetical protein
MYLAQVLEHAFVNLLTALRLHEKHRITRSEIDQFIESWHKQTFGRVLKELRRVATLPAALEDELNTLRNLRNFLAHHYFRSRAIEFVSEAGRVRMIKELQSFQAQLQSGDSELHPFFLRLCQEYGITEETFEASKRSLLESD